MNWQLINIIGYIVVILLSVIGACVVVFTSLIIATMISDKRRERVQASVRQEPITQVRVTTVARRQEVPDVFYRAFEEV